MVEVEDIKRPRNEGDVFCPTGGVRGRLRNGSYRSPDTTPNNAPWPMSHSVLKARSAFIFFAQPQSITRPSRCNGGQQKCLPDFFVLQHVSSVGVTGVTLHSTVVAPLLRQQFGHAVNTCFLLPDPRWRR